MSIIEIQPGDLEAIAEVDKIEYKHPPLIELDKHERSFLTASLAVDDVSANCHTDFHAYHNSGRRPLSVIDLIVMHSTEGGTSRSVARYFKEPSSGGSTQLVVDDYSCYRCLADSEIPWGAPGANYHGFHIEQCGYARWTQVLWSKTHRKTLLRAAYKAAYHCRRYGLKTRFLTATNLKAGMRNGITTHQECSVAFGGDHHDPGTGWPRVLFMTMVKGFYVALVRVKKVA